MANIISGTNFIDSPGVEQIIDGVNKWQKPSLSAGTAGMFPLAEKEDFRELCRLMEQKLAESKSLHIKKRLEKGAIAWLYDFIRINVKRGRIFELSGVLNTGRADCLGYSKLFTFLGRALGLDTGVAEVIRDNRGRIVPHTIALVKLTDGKRQLIDFWYGTKDITHKRLGIRVRREDGWRLEDIDYSLLKKELDIDYLPDKCVDAITLYVQGNRSLEKGDYVMAVRQYSRSIQLYPQNARPFYNRAIAYENLGETRKAWKDYVRALSDDSSILRTLATEPDDTVSLIRLDEGNIPEKHQQMYLLSRGFITGRRLSSKDIARKMGLSLEEVEMVLNSVGNLMSAVGTPGNRGE